MKKPLPEIKRVPGLDADPKIADVNFFGHYWVRGFVLSWRQSAKQ